MSDSKNLAIGVLSVTSVILLVGVILGGALGPQPAYGIGQIDRGGDYILVTGQYTDNSELLYVTDAAAQRMNLYSFEPGNRQFVLWDSIDLRDAFGTARR